MTMQMNQFTLQPLKGMLASLVNNLTLSVQLDPGSASAYLVPGDFVKLVSTTGPQIIVDVAGANDVAFGVIIYVPKKDKFYPGDTFEVAGSDSIIFLEASAAISRGDLLEFVPTGSKVKTNAGGSVVGQALDNASGSGSIIRAITAKGVGLTPVFTTVQFLRTLGVSIVLTPGATPALNAALGTNFTLTPGEDETINASNIKAGQDVFILVTTSGTTSRTLTFGTGFTSTGTLATGTTSGKKFLLHFRAFADGALVEVSRTAAM